MIWFIGIYLTLGLITAIFTALKLCVWEWGSIYGVMSVLIVFLAIPLWPIVWFAIASVMIQFGWTGFWSISKG